MQGRGGRVREVGLVTKDNDYALYPNKKALPTAIPKSVIPIVIPYKTDRVVNLSEFQIQES